VARALRFVPVDITLVARLDAHLFPARLYAAAVNPGEPRRLQVNLKSLLRGQTNVRFVHGEAVYLDARQRRLILADRALAYDVLVVATGSRPCYEREDWQRSAPGLQSAGDAGRIRAKLQDRDTAVVIVGGGVAGVELAAATARADSGRRVVLVEERARVLADFPEALAGYAAQKLARAGVEIRCGLHVTGIDRESVRVSGAQGRERILSRAALWAGGVQGSEFGEALRGETGVALDEAGRVLVNQHLTVAGQPEIFVIGDLARVPHDGRPLDGLATVASQQGRYVASAIRARMGGYEAAPFEYVDQGRFAILGRDAVGVIGDTQLRGTAAWLAARLAQKWSAPPGNLLPQFRAYSAGTGSST
jgi:NADH dehydrogenase